MNIIPGEQARRAAARWALWGYIVLAGLGTTLHLVRNIMVPRPLNGIYLMALMAIGGVAYVSLMQLKLSLSRAMILFAWITFGVLVILLDNDIRLVNQPTDVMAMFLVGVFTLGVILGFKAAIYYATATAVIFILMGLFYNKFSYVIVPAALAYAVALPAKVVEYLIEQSTHDLTQINQRLEDLVAARTLDLSESNCQLSAEVDERAYIEETLRQRTLELESRNEELNAYAHTVAHDIKSPLASIIGFGELFERHPAQFSEDQLAYYFGVIARNGRKITNIVDELLLLSSVREAEGVEIETLDMAFIVDEAQHRLVHDMAGKSPEILLPETWPAALGHAPWVEEIWTNYISNALKYGGAPPRVELGYTIREADSAQFDLASSIQHPASSIQYPASSIQHPASSIQHPVSSIQFWVRDNGPGLTLEEQNRLFTPFTRLDQVRARGHGLGLSIVRRIAERLGGEVGVESAPGQGSTFFFTLPSASARAARTRAASAPPGDEDDTLNQTA